jgi:ABC-type glycerol-3-phosphate transport system permease component
MNQKKFPLNQKEFLWIVLFTILPAVVFGIICFLSINFLSLGDTLLSLVVATVFALLLLIPVFVAICLKKTSRPSKASIIWEWILFFLFIFLAFVFLFPFSHYFVVSEKKDGIQQKLSQNVSEAKNMFAKYKTYANNREYIYEQELTNALSKGHDGSYIYPSKYDDFGFQAGGDDSKQKEDKLKDLHNGLFLHPFDYQKEKEKDLSWLGDAQNSIDSWAKISIVSVVKDMDNNIQTWFYNLVKLSKARGTGETAINFDEDTNSTVTILNVKRQFKKEVKDMFFVTNFRAIIFAIVLYFLMWLPWLPYIGIRRHSKYPGLKEVFGTEKKIEGSKRTIITSGIKFTS